MAPFVVLSGIGLYYEHLIPDTSYLIPGIKALAQIRIFVVLELFKDSDCLADY